MADENVALSLPPMAVQIIIGALGKRPYEEVANVIAMILAQYQAHQKKGSDKEPPGE